MKKKILIVDDEIENVQFLESLLAPKGYAITTAYDGETALEKARVERPDLILLDILLPKINGYEVCKILQSDEMNSQTPVVLLTAKGQAKDIKTGMSLGAVCYMVKPVKVDILMGIINNILGLT